MELTAALILLAVTLAAAIVRPRGLPEAVVAVPAAAACVVFGLLDAGSAGDEVRELVPTLGFLAAVLVLGRLCAAEGLFGWAGAVLSRTSAGRPRSMLGWVLLVGTAVTTVLSLDATVVLFTPIVLAAAVRAGVPARPHLHATVHVANSASLLLPVSNLTNLLAFEATGLSFGHFAALMALPLLVVLVVEYAGTRACFAGDLRPAPPSGMAAGPAAPVPWVALGVLGATLGALTVASELGVAPGVVAAAGAAALALRRLLAGALAPVELVRWAEPLFLVFVAALAIVVRAGAEHGLADAARPLVDHPGSLAGLLAVAAVGAVAANLLNNLPAVLLLLPLVSTAGPGPALALLLGVNIGPNLTYVGSLATMLWLRVLDREGRRPRLASFTVHGLVTAPAALLGATLALWCALRLGI